MASIKEARVALSSANNISIQSFFSASDWSNVNKKKRLVIPGGITIGSTTPATAALRTGSAWGGTLIIENNGTISGAGGTANSGVGGTAFLAEAAGVTLINTGTIRAGGGGGGVGGVGGQGYYQTPYTYQEGQYFSETYPGYYYWVVSAEGRSPNRFQWNGTTLYGPAGATGTSFSSGGWNYYRGSLQRTELYGEGSSSGSYYMYFYYIYRQQTRYNNTYTSGGAGGAGGRGQGHNGANAGGSGGAAGGTNAGTGGTGGTGGGYGASGATGNTGATGNYTGGVGGSGGGLAGYGLQNSGNISLTNTGSILGR